MVLYNNTVKTILFVIALSLSISLVTANELPTVELHQPQGQETPVQPTFEWTGQDAEGDSLDYKLLVSVNGGNPFLSPEYTQNYHNRQPGQKISVSPFDLENNQEYTWAVTVDDGGIGESRSDEWTFTTVEHNSPPQIELQDPGDGDTIELPYTFKWDVSDPDGDDIDHNTIVIEEDGDKVEEEQVGTDEEFDVDQDYLNTGDYSWYVVSEDVRGNTDTSESRSFTVEEVEETDQEGSLEVHVEDRGGKYMEDARVKLSDGVDRGPKYTDSRGDVDFNDLPPNTDIDVNVKCYGETENKYNVELDEEEHKSIDIEFDERFESDRCGEDTEEEPDARFDIDNDNPEVNEWVDFDASDSEGDIEKYHWEFGDGDTYTDDDPKVSHRYNEEGDYTVELTVEEHDGDKDTTTKTVEVGPQKEDDDEPEARFDIDDENPDVEQWVDFDASDSEGDIEKYHWEFGDGDTYTDDDPKISHRYNTEGEYTVELTVEEHDGDKDTTTKTVEVVSDKEKSGLGTLRVSVEDEDGDHIEDARVVVDSSNWFSDYTDRDGEVTFEIESGTAEVTVSKEGYYTKTRTTSISSGEDKDLSFTLREVSRTEREEQARLDVHVEDDDYDDLEDAKVTVENSDREIRYTDSDGDTRLYLDSDDYDIEVECNGEKEYRDVYLSEGEREDIDIRFDEDFDSDICGEEDEDRDRDTYDDRDDDDRDTEDDDAEGLAITDVSYPDSVCRGGSFSADMRIENRGGFHEIVTITGSGLGSISTGQSFSLDVAETKSASIRFTNVEGSGTEEFDIRATNHVSDQTKRTIDVRDCGAQIPDTDGGDFDSGAVTGLTAEVTPKKTSVGNTVKVKGYVDGVRGRSEVTIRANDERKATVSTQPDGYYVAYIRLDQVGENIIKVSSGQAETQSVVEAIPTSTLTGVSAPEKVFEGESYEICANVESQIEPKVFLLRDGKIIDSTLANGEVCFERTASKIGEHDFSITALTYGKESSSPTTTTEVLEVDSEVTNFPDKVATTESEEGMVKVELYNTHNELRRYNVKLNGIQSTWLSQSEEEVILSKGEKETVYFYLTPEEEGNFEPTVEVVSKDATIYSEEINVYAGGTKNLRKPSFFGRLGQIFGL